MNQSTLLQEGDDYYLEGDHLVFTEAYLKKRGYCCQSGCRHCPYSLDELISPDCPAELNLSKLQDSSITQEMREYLEKLNND